MITIAVANQKGGVGKTGVTVGLAGALHDNGYQVLVIDLEPQATASEWLGALPPGRKGELPEDVYGPQLLEALLHGKPVTPYETPSGVFIVPSGNGFGGFEIHAARMPQGKAEGLLKASLAMLPALWDVVLIDCPPSLGFTTMNALTAATGLLIPVKLDSASRTPLVRLFTAAQEIHGGLNPNLDLIGIVGTFHERVRGHQRDVLGWLNSEFAGVDEDLDEGEYPIVFPYPIRLSQHVSESHAAQLPVLAYLRQENIRQSVAREDFELLAEEFVRRSELGPPAHVTQLSEKVAANG